MDKLKPCPFCGGEAELIHDELFSFVKCKMCSAEARIVKVSARYCADEIAVEAWNRRIDNG